MSIKNEPQNTSSGPLPLERLARKVVEKSLMKRGFASADLITNWSSIVGEKLAAVTKPDRLKATRGKAIRGATLVIRVDRAALLDVSHYQSLLLEKINDYMGLGSVEKLVFTPADLFAEAQNSATPAPKPDNGETAQTGLMGALQRLAAHVKSEK